MEVSNGWTNLATEMSVRPELATINSGELFNVEMSSDENRVLTPGDTLEVTTLFPLWPTHCRLAFDGMISPHQTNRRQIIRRSRFQINLPKGQLGIGFGYVREGVAILLIKHDSPLKQIKLYDVVTALTIDGVLMQGLGARARFMLAKVSHGHLSTRIWLHGARASFLAHLDRPLRRQG